MKSQRTAAFLCIVVEAATCSLMLGYLGFPAMVVALSLVGWRGRWRFAPSRSQRALLYLALAVSVSLEWHLLLIDEPEVSVLLTRRSGCAVGQYFLLLQVAALFARSESGRMPTTFSFFGIIVMTCLGDVFMSGAPKVFYHGAVVAFIVLTAAYVAYGTAMLPGFSRRRARRYWVLTGAVLALALTLGGTMSAVIKLNQEGLDAVFVDWVLRRTMPQTMGFSDRAYLSSLQRLKMEGADAVALRVFADNRPGYLRGKAYGAYEKGRWIAGTEAHLVHPTAAAGALSLAPGDHVFVLREGVPTSETMAVWPRLSADAPLFMPLGAAAVAAPVDRIVVDDNGNVNVSFVSDIAAYRIGIPAGAARAVHDLPRDTDLTSVPEMVAEKVRPLAASLFEGRSTAKEKMDAVVAYFRDNYQYDLKISIPKEAEPVTYFLLERPPGYCEYFASGAVILLRLGGVPCRYVTGFVAAEHNPYGGYWIARNRDAHAWVEAYDAGIGWTIVEPTVAEGVPALDRPETDSALDHLWDALRIELGALRKAFAATGFKGVAREVFRWLTAYGMHLGIGLAGLLITVYAAAALVTWLVRRNRVSRGRVAEDDPLVMALNGLLDQMDRRVKAMGLARMPTETLHQFATRVMRDHPGDPAACDAAAWYRDYAAARFGPHRDQEIVATLRTRVEAWQPR